MKRIIYIILSAIFSTFILIGVNFAATDNARVKYEEGLKLAKDKEYDFAFLAFRSIISEYPKSKYAQDALFALGEYFYLIKSYDEAGKNFNQYINNYGNSTASIFAKVYLLKIIPHTGKVPERKQEAIDKLTADFFSQPLLLLFSDYKEISYLSPFQNEFTARYYVDKIEVYKNGEVFARLTP